MTAAALKAEDSAPVRLAGATRAQILRTLAETGTPERELKMRASQLWHWIYHRGAREFSAMRNIARPVLDRLAERCTLARPEIVAEQLSADGARKWLLRLAPAHRFDKGAEIECFYIPGITATRPTLPLLRWRARHRPWACVPAWGATTRLRRRVIASRSASSPSGRPIDSLRRRAGRAGSSGSLVEKIGEARRGR
jgi:hypothetical protein